MIECRLLRFFFKRIFVRRTTNAALFIDWGHSLSLYLCTLTYSRALAKEACRCVSGVAAALEAASPGSFTPLADMFLEAMLPLTTQVPPPHSPSRDRSSAKGTLQFMCARLVAHMQSLGRFASPGASVFFLVRSRARRRLR
jgi:hypothetical protein